MKNTHDKLKIHLAEALFKSLPSELQSGLSVAVIYDGFGPPPNAEMGDLAFGCFQLSKLAKKSPAEISKMLAQGVSGALAGVATAEAAGPYLNFRVSPGAFGKFLLNPILTGEYFKRELTIQNPRTMIEYSQPNTHKEIHVGHMRNACLGDALIKLLRYSGTPVISSTFPGDVGTHVAKCLWYMKYHNQEPIPDHGKGEWLGRMYSKAHLKLEDELGSANEEKNRAELTLILKQLEAKSGEYYELWKETRQWSIDLMNSVYAWVGISFDQWYWESEVDSASVDYIKKLYAEEKLTESQGAVGMDLSAENLGFCLLLKTDGTGLYATKDIELARRKFQEHHIERSIYVVDMRQALHFQQVFKTLERLGFEQAGKCFHLQYNFVELPDGAMSSRKGNIVPLMTLVRSMEEHVKTQYLSRYQGDWSQDEINQVAHVVAQGAIKYGMIKIDNNKKIVFDMAEWLKLDGDSGPFIQYSAARIFSLLRKLGPISEKVSWELLVHPSEHKLMSHLSNFNSVVANAAETLRPSVVCTYLLETAQAFNHFYHECSIGQAESSELKNARLALAETTGRVLKTGLGVLGIPTPERM